MNLFHLLLLKYDITNKTLLHCCYTTVYSVTTWIEKIKTCDLSSHSLPLYRSSLAVHVTLSQLVKTDGQMPESICPTKKNKIIYFFKKLLWSIQEHIHIFLSLSLYSIDFLLTASMTLPSESESSIKKSISLGHTHPQFFADTLCMFR